MIWYKLRYSRPTMCTQRPRHLLYLLRPNLFPNQFLLRDSGELGGVMSSISTVSLISSREDLDSLLPAVPGNGCSGIDASTPWAPLLL